MNRPMSVYGNALTDAVAAGNAAAVRACLAAGHHPDDEEAVDDLGCSPLQRAISDVEDIGDGLVRLLLEAGAEPNGTAWSDGTPLLTAALYGDVGIIRLLVEHGGDASAAEPVAVAEREGHTDAMLMLRALRRTQGSPLRTAALYGDAGVMRYLLEHCVGASASEPVAVAG